MPPVEGDGNLIYSKELTFVTKYCRMCALELKSGVFIFGEEGKRLQVSEKIRKTVSILVLEEDSLPKKICTDCCSSLEDYAHYKDTVLDAQEKLASIAKQLEKTSNCTDLTVPQKSRLSETNPQQILVSPIQYTPRPALPAPSTRTKSSNSSPILTENSKREVEDSSEFDRFKCGLCRDKDDLFSDKESFLSHVRRSHPESRNSPKFKCLHCSEVLHKHTVLRAHMRNHNSGEGRLRKTNYFSPEKNSNPHLPKRSVSGCVKDASLSCKDCGKRFNTKTGLETHVLSKHPPDPVSPYDPKDSESQDVDTYEAGFPDTDDHDDLTNDSTSHPVPSNHPSPPESSHGGSRTSKFIKANPSIDGRRDKDREMQQFKKCNLSIPTASESTNLPDKGSQDATACKESSKPKMLQCNVCDKVLYSTTGYHNHMMTHNGRKFDCDQCSATYLQKATLIHHKNVHHQASSKKLSCTVCQKEFYELKFLTQHLKTHSSSPEEHKCEICMKSYKTLRNLRRHTKLHNSVKKFACSVCSKGFRVKSKLEEHENSHTGKKPLGCPFCDKGFNCYPNYVKHVKRKHPGEVVQENKIPAPRKSVSTGTKKQANGNESKLNTSSEVSNTNSHGTSAHISQTSAPTIAPTPAIPAPAHNPEFSHPLGSSTLQSSYVAKSFNSSVGGPHCSATAHSSTAPNQASVNALDLVDCAIQSALACEPGNGNGANHVSNFDQSSLQSQNEPMELSYKLDSSAFQDMPMELTKVFQRDPLELCVRHDFNQLMDLSSRVDQSTMPVMGVGMGMGMSNMNSHKLDLTERELMDLSGAFRQPIDLIARADDTPHDLYSEGSLVDLSLRSGFGQDQSASSFLREWIDLSARSNSFNEELDLTKPTHNNHAHHNHHLNSHHHSSSITVSHAHTNTSPKNGHTSLQNVVYQDAMFSLQS